jgi:hypothetical protein
MAMTDALLGMVDLDMLRVCGSHSVVEATVPDGWHTIVAALVGFTAAGIFLPLSFYRHVK